MKVMRPLKDPSEGVFKRDLWFVACQTVQDLNGLRIYTYPVYSGNIAAQTRVIPITHGAPLLMTTAWNQSPGSVTGSGNIGRRRLLSRTNASGTFGVETFISHNPLVPAGRTNLLS